VHTGKQTEQKEENRSMTIFIFGHAANFDKALFCAFWQACRVT